MADIELYQQLAERHGHYCPMSTLGVRLGEEAVRLLAAVAASDVKLFYLAKTCAADGIRIVFESAGYAVELEVDPREQHCLYCVIKGDKELSIQLSDYAMQLAAGYRNLPENAQIEKLDQLRTVTGESLVVVTGSVD